jgi:hypothetical protein
MSVHLSDLQYLHVLQSAGGGYRQLVLPRSGAFAMGKLLETLPEFSEKRDVGGCVGRVLGVLVVDLFDQPTLVGLERKGH